MATAKKKTASNIGMAKETDFAPIPSGKRFLSPSKVLVATSLAAHKDYCLAFLWDVLASLEAAAAFYVALDDWEVPAKEAKRAPTGTHFETLPPLVNASGFSRFARMREATRRYFLTTDCTHLLFLDADIIPPTDLIPRLLAHERPLATGLYCLRGFTEAMIPVVTLKAKLPIMGSAILAEQLGTKATVGGYLAGENIPEGNALDIQAFGLGAMLIRRAALEKVPFRPAEYWDDPAANGEDIQFCFDAYEASGIPPLLDLCCPCWHVNLDGRASRVTLGESAYGAFYDDAGSGYETRGHKFPQRVWHRGAPKFPGPQPDGEADLTLEEIAALGPSFYRGACRRLMMEMEDWKEAMKNR